MLCVTAKSVHVKHVPVAQKKSGAVSSANVAFPREAKILTNNNKYLEVDLYQKAWTIATITIMVLLSVVSKNI